MELSRPDPVGGLPSQPPEILPPFIFGLPPELLAEIVAAVAAIEVPRAPITDYERFHLESSQLQSRATFKSIFGEGTLGWVRLTHVCRGWRSLICEGMPLLWAQHIGCFGRADAVETMLRRAGNEVSLSVRSGHCGAAISDFPWETVEMPVPSWSALECTIFRSRIRSLVVVDTRNGLGNGTEFESLASILHELTCLQELGVHCITVDDERLRDDLPPCPNTCIIFAPTLRSLRFTNHFISWNASGVTRLSIVLDAIGLPWDVFHDALTSLSSIEELELDYALPANFSLSRSVQEYTTYPLPKLGYLSVRDLDDYALGFLQQLQLPDSARLDLRLLCTDSWYSARFELAVQKVLARARSLPSRTIVVAATFGEDEKSAVIYNFAQLRFYEGASLIAGGTADLPHLAVAVEDLAESEKNSWEGLAEVRVTLNRHFPDVWHNVQSLDFSVPFWRCRYEIGQMLSRASSLRQLRVIDLFEGVERNHDFETDWPGSVLFPTSLFRDPAPSLDLLWIIQTSNWRVNHLRQFCTAVARSLADAIDASRLHHRHEDANVAKRAITLLRLDFVHQYDTSWTPDEEDSTIFFEKLAESVEVHFL
ncbi:unnamed protein product [Peniophora sp. CBMAI 1063]|nr:unnamed protein product [Peniophora sp. CBMAI 1063]